MIQVFFANKHSDVTFRFTSKLMFSSFRSCSACFGHTVSALADRTTRGAPDLAS